MRNRPDTKDPLIETARRRASGGEATIEFVTLAFMTVKDDARTLSILLLYGAFNTLASTEEEIVIDDAVTATDPTTEMTLEKFDATMNAPDTVNDVQLELDISGARDELRPVIVIEEITTESSLKKVIKGRNSPPAISEGPLDEPEDTVRPTIVMELDVLDASKKRRLLDPLPEIDASYTETVLAEVIFTRLVRRRISGPPTERDGAESMKESFDMVFADVASGIFSSSIVVTFIVPLDC